MTIPDPDSGAGQAKVQRVSLQGAIATASALSAVIVAVASMFTAVQALDVSQAAARQKIFEQQLSTCLAFSDLTTRATSDGEKKANLLEGVIDDSNRDQFDEALAASDTLSGQLHQQYLQMTMLLPDEISDKAYKALEKRTEIYNAQIEALNNETVSPQTIAQLATLASQEQDLLIEAADACRDFVSSQAGLD